MSDEGFWNALEECCTFGELRFLNAEQFEYLSKLIAEESQRRYLEKSDMVK